MPESNSYEALKGPTLNDNTLIEAETEVNPYAIYLEDTDSELRASSYTARKTNPDQYSKIVDSANKSGIPVDVAERNPEEVAEKVEAENNSYEALRSNSPKTSNYLSSTENMKKAKDDIKNLTGMEWLLNAPVEAYKEGQRQVEGGELGFKNIFGKLSEQEQERLDVLSAEPEGDFGTESWVQEGWVESFRMLPNILSVVKGGIKGGATGALLGTGAAVIGGQIGPQVLTPEELVTVPLGFGTGFAVGSKIGAAEQAFRLESGFAYNEFRSIKDKSGEPLDENVAKLAALAAGGVNAGLEFLGLKVLVKAFPGGERLLGQFTRKGIGEALKRKSVQEALKTFATNYGKAFVIENLTEVTQEAVTILAGELAKNISDGDFTNITAEEFGQRIVEVSNKTAQAMLFLAAPGPGAKFASDVARAKKADVTVNTLEALGDTAEASKLRERLPEDYSEFVKGIKEKGGIEDVYIEADKFVRYWESQKVDASVIATDLGIEDQLAEVTPAGDLVIPIETYASKVAATDHKGLLNDLRLFKGDMSKNEAEIFSSDFEEEFNQTVKDLVEDKQIEADKTVASTKVFKAVDQKDVVTAFEKPGLPSVLRESTPLFFNYLNSLSETEEIKTYFSKYEEARSIIKAEVEQKQPAYIASYYLRTGSFPNKETPNALKGLKLNKKYMEEKYGKDVISKLPENAIGSYGIKPDELAGMFGYSSGDQLIQYLLNTTELAEQIEAATDEILLSRKPDLLVAGDELAEATMLLEWLNVDSFENIGTKQYEQFAEALELYVMEGKAPFVEITPVFSRSVLWHKDMYRGVTKLNAKTSEDVREVFNRLFATDFEVQNAKNLYNFRPLFRSAEEAGMTDKEYFKYTKSAQQAVLDAEDSLREGTFENIRNQKTSEYEEARSVVKAEVEQKLLSKPAYMASHYLRTGSFPNLETPDEIKGLKLNQAYMVENYGSGIIDKLPVNAVGAYGINPDELAVMLGYSSGDQLIQVLLNTTELSERVEAATDEIMFRRNPDLLVSRDELEDATIAAYSNKTQTDVLLSELRSLTKRADLESISAKAITVTVRKQLNNSIVKDIDPKIHVAKATRASNNSQKALKKGDYKTAALHKFEQVVSLKAFREAIRAKKQINRAVKSIKRFNKKSVRAKFGKAGIEYLDQIDVLMARFDFRPTVPVKAIARKEALVNWIDKKRQEGDEVIIDPSLVNEAYRKHYKDLKLFELLNINDAVKNLAHLVSIKKDLVDSAKKDTYDNVREGIVSTIVDNNKLKKLDFEFAGTNKVDKVKEFISGIHASSTKMEFFFRKLDGDTPQGKVWTALFKPIADAEGLEHKASEQVIERFRKVFDRYTKKERSKFLSKKIFIPAIDKSFTKSSIMMVALNAGNAANKEALLSGYGWSEEQFSAVVDVLDKRDWDTVQDIFDILESLWPQIEQLQRELTGLPPAKVEATPITTKFGVYAGGYFPIVSDSKYSHAMATTDVGKSLSSLFEYNYAYPQTKQGHVIERTEFGDRVVKLDFNVMFEHVLNVVHDLTHRKAVIDVDRLAQDRDIRHSIVAAGGLQMYKQIRPWLKDIANRKLDPPNFFERIMTSARVGATVVNMGWKATTGITQILGYLNTIDLIGPKYAWKGFSSFFAASPFRLPENMKTRRDFVMLRSEEMRNRKRTFDRDINDIPKKLFENTAIRESYFFFTSLMDMAVSIPTWLGAYEQGLKRFNGDEVKAISHADSSVRLSQGSGSAKDLAQVQRGSPIMRAFTMFYSYFSALYGQFSRVASNVARVGPKGIPRFMGSMLFLWFAPSVLSELIAGRGPDDDESWVTWSAKNGILYPTQTVVGLRDVASAMIGDYGYQDTPASRAFKSLVNISEQVLQLEADRRALETTIEAIGYWGKLPTRQIWITGEGLYDYMTDDRNAKFHHLAFPKKRGE